MAPRKSGSADAQLARLTTQVGKLNSYLARNFDQANVQSVKELQLQEGPWHVHHSVPSYHSVFASHSERQKRTSDMTKLEAALQAALSAATPPAPPPPAPTLPAARVQGIRDSLGDRFTTMLRAGQTVRDTADAQIDASIQESSGIYNLDGVDTRGILERLKADNAFLKANQAFDDDHRFYLLMVSNSNDSTFQFIRDSTEQCLNCNQDDLRQGNFFVLINGQGSVICLRMETWYRHLMQDRGQRHFVGTLGNGTRRDLLEFTTIPLDGNEGQYYVDRFTRDIMVAYLFHMRRTLNLGGAETGNALMTTLSGNHVATHTFFLMATMLFMCGSATGQDQNHLLQYLYQRVPVEGVINTYGFSPEGSYVLEPALDELYLAVASRIVEIRETATPHSAARMNRYITEAYNAMSATFTYLPFDSTARSRMAASHLGKFCTEFNVTRPAVINDRWLPGLRRIIDYCQQQMSGTYYTPEQLKYVLALAGFAQTLALWCGRRGRDLGLESKCVRRTAQAVLMEMKIYPITFYRTFHSEFGRTAA